MHPREFGKFRIVSLLPKGGMGTVYLAVNTVDNARVALKLIELGPDADRQEIAAAERRGAILQRQICGLDKRITQIRDSGEFGGFFYIEMEFIEGQDLSELLRTGPLGVPFAARIGLDLCEVLDVAHTFHATIESQAYRGIVHGDIKPRNIRITPDGELRVLDFGIAKALSLTRSFTQILFGSVQYSSPERLQTGEVTIASDLWAVSVVLWEIVTSRPYFEAENGPRLENLIRNYSVPRSLPASLPAPFGAILSKALHPDPALRYQTAADFRDDLRAYLEARPTAAESMDSEATRRTSPTALQEEATRRTAIPARPVAASAAANGVASAVPARKGFLTPQVRRFVAGIVLAILLVAAWLVVHEISVWRRGDQLVRELQTERLTDMNAAFVRYQELQDENHLPLVLHTPRRTILDKLTSLADRNLAEYRDSETPTVSETDWVKSQTALGRALELEPGDKEIRAKLYLCEGQIARIKGTARVSGKLLNEARSKFEAAHALMPRWPDPYIGLASLYTYSLKDVERAEEAVQNAAKRGHKAGRREKAQLADAYRGRAERLLREADKASGLPEEKDYLERASSDLKRAQDLYRDIVPFAGSPGSLRRSIEYSGNIDLRLKAIREGA